MRAGEPRTPHCLAYHVHGSQLRHCRKGTDGTYLADDEAIYGTCEAAVGEIPTELASQAVRRGRLLNGSGLSQRAYTIMISHASITVQLNPNIDMKPKLRWRTSQYTGMP